MPESLDYWNYTRLHPLMLHVGMTVEVWAGDVVRIMGPESTLPMVWPAGSYIELTLVEGMHVFRSSYTPTPDSGGPDPDVVVFRDNFPHFAKEHVDGVVEKGLYEVTKGLYEVTAKVGFAAEFVPYLYQFYK